MHVRLRHVGFHVPLPLMILVGPLWLACAVMVFAVWLIIGFFRAMIWLIAAMAGALS